MAATLALRALLVACALLTAGTALGQPMSAVRLTHLSPDAPRVDLVIDHQLFLRDVGYGQVTPYTALPAGQHEISVYPHRPPQRADDGGAERFALEPVTILVDLVDGMYYTFAVSGFFQDSESSGATGALAVEVEPDDARVTVAGPRGFTSDFVGDRLLRDLEPGDYQVQAEHEEYEAITHEAEVRPLETGLVSITLPRTGEGAGDAGVETAGRGNTTGWRGIGLHAFRDDLGEAPPPGGSRIRLLHLSPVTAAVDLLALPAGGGEPVVLASGISFPNAGAYVRLPGREFTLQVRLAGSDAVLYELPELLLEPGAAYTLFLVREPDDNYLRLVPAVDMIVTVRR